MTALGASGDAFLTTRCARMSDRPIPPDDLSAELQIAVEKAATRSAGSMDALHRAVTRFTVALRDQGAQPEEVLIAIKTVIDSKTLPSVEFRYDANPDDLRQLISSWAIRDFFYANKA